MLRIKKNQFKQIVVEELLGHMRSLLEADGEEDEKEAETDPPPAASLPRGGGPAPAEKVGKDKTADKKPDPEADKETEEEPTDLEKDLEDGEEGDDDRDADIADELTGLSIQSTTMEPNSKILPGATEFVITFKETQKVFKVLVTKTGAVKFFWDGAVHNEI